MVEDEQYGAVRVRAWAGLHPKQQNHPTAGTRKPRADRPRHLVLVEVSRLPARPYPPQVLWLWWAGPGSPDLDAALAGVCPPLRPGAHAALLQAERSAGRRPRVRSPEQADRWTWLVVAAYTQLRLARPWVADRRLPWERPARPREADPLPGAPGHSVPLGHPRQPRDWTKTLRSAHPDAPKADDPAVPHAIRPSRSPPDRSPLRFRALPTLRGSTPPDAAGLNLKLRRIGTTNAPPSGA